MAIIYQHHERENGSGYPKGLSNRDIMLEAKILAVTDTVESMATDRPYRPTLGIGRALKEAKQIYLVF
jgi:HD-GYP domain-containing protein (c-di-GMP phosphodiesterase class II)